MLFNSYIFILIFLPSTLAIFHGLHNLGLHRASTATLALASLIFYGWWSIQALFLLLVLMGANYVVVWKLLTKAPAQRMWRWWLTATAIAGNLFVLGYFKYANFFLENWAAVTKTEANFVTVVLPLGLSFFTFQKIALIVDAYRGRVCNFDPLGYVLFVSFFPQLIAGPIVHHSEVMPQFARREPVRTETVAQGLTLFVIGLAKKVILADTIAQWATPIFDMASSQAPSFADAWTATLAYALQLYFDFSGYSDMAIGLALLFGVRLPINFNSPYKARNIIEFWRCWHMTLSRFLRDYLYIPLGGNRRGQLNRFLNLALTMVLGGLWHGAGWTFVIWGALHAFYLIVNHGWNSLRARFGWFAHTNVVTRLVAHAITFTAVLVAWVFFRAADVGTAMSMLQAMVGFDSHAASTLNSAHAVTLVGMLLALVWFAPNSGQIVAYAFAESTPSSAPKWIRWRPSPAWAVACGLIGAFCLMSLTHVTEFLYFQF